jgi:hypothetical protein
MFTPEWATEQIVGGFVLLSAVAAAGWLWNHRPVSRKKYSALQDEIIGCQDEITGCQEALVLSLAIQKEHLQSAVSAENKMLQMQHALESFLYKDPFHRNALDKWFDDHVVYSKDRELMVMMNPKIDAVILGPGGEVSLENTFLRRVYKLVRLSCEMRLTEECPPEFVADQICRKVKTAILKEWQNQSFLLRGTK